MHRHGLGLFATLLAAAILLPEAPAHATPVRRFRALQHALRLEIRDAAREARTGIDPRTALDLVHAYFPGLTPRPAPVSLHTVARRPLPTAAYPLHVTPPVRPRGSLVVTTRGLTFRIHRVGAPWPSVATDGARFDGPTHLLVPRQAAAPGATRWVTGRVDEYQVRRRPGRYTATYEVALPPSVTEIHDAGTYLELCDAHRVPKLRFHLAVARDAAGTQRRGKLVVAGLAPGGWARVHGTVHLSTTVSTAGLEAPVVVDPGWSSTGSMAQPRYAHTATRLESGKVLVVGGVDSQYLASCEIYDPATATWSATGSLNQGRAYHTATLLHSGEVLVTGGSMGVGLKSAELYDPATGKWTFTGSMAVPRTADAATLLQDGRVLVAGGEDGDPMKATIYDDAELYDPASGTWSSGGTFPGVREDESATLLNDGDVLVVGGDGGGNSDTALLYHPGTNTWSTTANPITGRTFLSAVRLSSGKVLVAGTGALSGTTAAEVYDPSTATWASVGTVSGAGVGSLTLLPSGKVLVVRPYFGKAELYDPATQAFTPVGDLTTTRAGDTATLLSSGKVLLAGGSSSGKVLASAEVYPDGAPVAGDQAVSTPAGTPVAITLTATDPENNSLTYAVVGDPSHGTLSGSPPGLVYTPDAGYQGADAFSFVASDGVMGSNVATVSIAVTGTPSGDTAPVADDQAVSTGAGANVSITLQATDADGDPLTYAVVEPPTHGALSGTAPALTYAPQPGFHGVDAFSFKANDGVLDSNLASVIVGVGDTAPVAQDQSLTTGVGAMVGVTLTATDADGDPLAYGVIAGPSHGTLTGRAPSLVYTPAAGYQGSDAFTFAASDGALGSNVATVNLTMSTTAPAEAAPVAADQRVQAPAGAPVPVTLSATDVNGDPLTYTVVTQPAHGALSGTPPSLTYTPDAAFRGRDAFTFKASDGTLESNVARVSLHLVDVAPVAADQSVSAVGGVALPLTLAAADANGDALTYTVVGQPAHGTITGTPPAISYTATASYSGADTLTFVASDGVLTSNLATVRIAVTAGAPPDTAPVAADQSVSTTVGTPVIITLSASDAERDPLTYAVAGFPRHGTLTGTPPQLVYTPASGYQGPDGFSFLATDGTLGSNVASVAITVTGTGSGDAAPVAADQSLSTHTGVPVPVTLSAVDVHGDALTYAVVGQPAHGKLSGTAPSLTYTPAAGFHGADTFTFEASDGTLDSNVATVGIAVSDVAPVAQEEVVAVLAGSPAGVTLLATDADGDPLTFAVVGDPAHGKLSGTAPSLVYTPASGYQGDDAFTFVASDGALGSNVATVHLTVSATPPPEEAPVAADQTRSVPANAQVAITLSATDVNGDALTYSVVVQPSHGTLSGKPPKLTYTPNPAFLGADAFTFKANDGTLDSNVATVSLQVTDSAPVAKALKVSTAAGKAVPVQLSATDPNGDALTYLVVTRPAHGALSGSAPKLTYTPKAGYHGADDLTYVASDGVRGSNVATVAITVTGKRTGTGCGCTAASGSPASLLGILLALIALRGRRRRA